MRIWFHRYELRPHQALNSRTGNAPRLGALLRVEFPAGPGHADCHPWEEFGDAPLAAQLEALARGERTVLTERSLEFARLDAEARGRGRSLFEGLTIPESHYLATGIPELSETKLQSLHEQGFERVKIKVGRDPGTEARALGELALPEGMLLRLDFNSALKVKEFEVFLETARETAKAALERLEFIEDPVGWDRAVWGWLRRERGARLALDREVERAWGARGLPAEALDVVVHKPAVQKRFTESFPVVFTSNMDHPLGQVSAAYVAAREKARRPGGVLQCGLLSHAVFAKNAFSEALRVQGPRLLPPEGTGFGFDSLLAGLDWEKLR